MFGSSCCCCCLFIVVVGFVFCCCCVFRGGGGLAFKANILFSSSFLLKITMVKIDCLLNPVCYLYHAIEYFLYSF